MTDIDTLERPDVEASGRWVHPLDRNGNELPGFVWLDARGARWTAPPDGGGILLDEPPAAIVRGRGLLPASLLTTLLGSLALAGLLVSGGPTAQRSRLTTRAQAAVSARQASDAAGAQAAPAPGSSTGAGDIANALIGSVDLGGGPGAAGGIVSALIEEATPPPPPRVTARPTRPSRTAAPKPQHQAPANNNPPPSHQDETIIIIQDGSNPGHSDPGYSDPGHDESGHSGGCDC